MKGFCLEVSGEFACFTRPEMKIERVSYDVITPSAARAVFEAVLWKPAIRWQIERIEVLKPITWTNVRRNEVGSVIPMGSVKTAMKCGKGMLGLYVEDDRQQRAGLILRDVAYRLHAHFEMTDKAGTEDNEGKFADMFRRRASSGQCFNQPYLGCREFSARFRLVEPNLVAMNPIPESRDLGWVLYDLDYSDAKNIRPLFFRAQLENGVVQVPPRSSQEVLG